MYLAAQGCFKLVLPNIKSGPLFSDVIPIISKVPTFLARFRVLNPKLRSRIGGLDWITPLRAVSYAGNNVDC
jgi:hypothetical protein